MHPPPHTHTVTYSLPNELLYSEEPTRIVAATAKHDIGHDIELDVGLDIGLDIGLEEEWKWGENLLLPKEAGGRRQAYTRRIWAFPSG